MAAGDEDWRKNTNTQKVNSETFGKAGTDSSKRGAGVGAGADGVLHQTRKLPYSPWKMAVGGAAVVGAIFFMTLYTKKKPEASAGDVIRVATNTARPEDTHPRK